jgi:hypothetical protein
MESETLVTKFLTNRVAKLQKEYRIKNKDLNIRNIDEYVTLGVIDRKGYPEIDDCVLLIMWGNVDCTEEQALLIVQRELDAGSSITDIFCRLCKAYVRDIYVSKAHRDKCNDLENLIENRYKLRNEAILNLIKQGLNKNKEDGLGVENEIAKQE